MNTIKANSDKAKREIGDDVESMLRAIHERISGDVKNYIDNETEYPLRAGHDSSGSCNELADVFELDIHDYASYEVNR